MQRKEERLVPISAYLEASIVDAIKKIAEADERSMSYIVRAALVEYIKRRK